MDDLKLFSVSFLWSQTNSEKLNVTLNEVANFQTDTWILNGNDFDIDFRQVFKNLDCYAIRRCQIDIVNGADVKNRRYQNFHTDQFLLSISYRSFSISASFDHYENEINPKTRLSCIDGDLLKTGKFIYSEKVKLNYTKAESFCGDLGLQLLMPQSIEENDQPEF